MWLFDSPCFVVLLLITNHFKRQFSWLNLIPICFREWESVYMGQRSVWTAGQSNIKQSGSRAAGRSCKPGGFLPFRSWNSIWGNTGKTSAMGKPVFQRTDINGNRLYFFSQLQHYTWFIYYFYNFYYSSTLESRMVYLCFRCLIDISDFIILVILVWAQYIDFFRNVIQSNNPFLPISLFRLLGMVVPEAKSNFNIILLIYLYAAFISQCYLCYIKYVWNVQ